MGMSKTQSITPKCCEKVQIKNTVFLCYGTEIYNGKGLKDIQPKWKSGSNNSEFQCWATTEVKFCPHCATPVPPIKRRNTKRKICDVKDGGYYCSTCDKRLQECTCFRPEYAWEPDYSLDTEELKLLNKLKNKLKKDKYEVKHEKRFGYHFLRIENKGIYGGACTTNEHSNRYLSGKLAVDRADCFDKWSKCPINLPLPKNEKEINFIMKKLKWLQTKEGFEVSNNYEFDKWITEYKEK